MNAMSARGSKSRDSPATARKTTSRHGARPTTGSKGSSRLKTATPTVKQVNPPSSSPQRAKKVSKDKVTAHVDAKVAKRNAALNAMGGMKVDVFVRVRPPLAREKEDKINVAANTEENNITLSDKEGNPNSYAYDKVYGPEASQVDVFDGAVSPIIEQVIRGMSCAIFAYGQTGSGKTHTMRGTSGADASDHGVIQRSLEALLRRLPEQDYTDVSLSISFLEVYNEELMDMLRPDSTARLMLVDDDNRGTVCHGLTEVPVTGVKEVLDMLDEADKNTKVSETKMNKFSNRAHRIFTIIIKFKRWETDVVSTLTFVDLAGSEDIGKSGAKGITAREAAHINKSLLTLGRVINALAKSEKHIPYRDSKLTRLLSEALGGVCKTTFIACVSPCISSFTETQSTLRYAERAMEALNISQLPRWKQQEIIIDHLNRRLLAMEEEMGAAQERHAEEIHQLKSQNEAIEAERKLLAIQNYKLERKVERLLVRKSKLKTGLSMMTSERDMLHTQKEALRTELLQTRQQRDGYLADRSAQSSVLASVRAMRERLLEAHQSTEASLSDDAVKLKDVIEGAIEDIGELHTEVARKKSLSAHNEKAADEFRDRMSGRLRGIVQTVVDFQHANQAQHADIARGLLELRDQDQADTTANSVQLSGLSAAASESLSGISAHCKATEESLLTQLSKRGASVEQYSKNVAATMEKFRLAVASQIEKLREEATDLDDRMSDWSLKIQAKLDERADSVKEFSAQLADGLTQLDASVSAAATDHLTHIAAHRKDLVDTFDAEKAALEEDSAQLIGNISSYVERMISEFSSKCVTRAQVASARQTVAADVLSGEVSDLLTAQKKAIAVEQAATSAWADRSAEALAAGKLDSSAAHKTASNMLAAVVETSRAGDAELENGVSSIKSLQAEFSDASLAALQESREYTSQRTADTVEHVTRTATSVKNNVENLKSTVSSQHAALSQKHASLNSQISASVADLKSASDTANDSIFEAEADSVNYVMEEVLRDTQAPPPRKSYTFPHEFESTDVYSNILRENADDYAREASIQKGELSEGPGTDFPAVIGPEEPSGLFATTEDAPRSEEIQAALAEAAAQSSAEDYVVEEDSPSPNETSPNENSSADTDL